MEASKWRRLANFAIDSGCVLFLFLAVLRVLPAGLIAVNNYRFIILGVMFSYYILAELLFKRTLGKLFTSTHIVTTSDDTPTQSKLLLRTVLRFLPLEPLSLVFSRRALAWHDRFSGTKVVYLNF
ncbi:RDD family protein [Hymenobacter setariae]|uniref:RDD family protein n=1 Tax=Hymenobacter setariae TaxID=2594794 RepID=A0A558C3K6_9BACT|nr:RDD family protein [Hymenobacter setariae]TVT43267.1 RDD family protein [Hymenobacter setariae]